MAYRFVIDRRSRSVRSSGLAAGARSGGLIGRRRLVGSFGSARRGAAAGELHSLADTQGIELACALEAVELHKLALYGEEVQPVRLADRNESVPRLDNVADAAAGIGAAAGR